ncbi:hypothetical protein DFQ10_107185 [Winogradskyella eximia]|uniref:YD repeat-containing protein n=1 Tax=Winogradskyella eximia TaxID=262006 RepID=A0A3D9H0G0_9FLAO|nr:hypothetical protein DFQ10_107185 [Winogradskyella eximia]
MIITYSSFSQSIWKKGADLKKRNGIKETTIYLQNLDNESEKRIWDWSSYDKEGKLIESKRFLENGKLKTHFKFEYPTKKTRILIYLDKRGNETKRVQQEFDLSGEKEPLVEKSKSGIFRYEYDENGNKIKVWNIKKNPEVLQTEVFFDENNLRYKERLLITRKFGSEYMTRIYTRDKSGNILKIISEMEGEINSIEIHEHKKYST